MSVPVPEQRIIPGAASPSLQSAADDRASGESGRPAAQSVPPKVPSLPPPAPRADVAAPADDLSAEHRWLTDPRMALLRRAVSDHRLVTIHNWGIDPTWTTNQVVSHVHVMLERKADRKEFEARLAKCDNKADLIELVYATLVAIPPDVAARLARMRDRSR